MTLKGVRPSALKLPLALIAGPEELLRFRKAAVGFRRQGSALRKGDGFGSETKVLPGLSLLKPGLIRNSLRICSLRSWPFWLRDGREPDRRACV